MSSRESKSPDTFVEASLFEKNSQEILASGSRKPRRIARLIYAAIILLTAVGAFVSWRLVRTSIVAQSRQKCRDAQANGDWTGLAAAADRWRWWQADDGQAIIFRALAYEKTGQLDAAVNLLDSISDVDEFAYVGLLAQVDLLLFRLHRPTRAEEACRRILRLEPSATEAHLRLLYVYSSTLQQRKLLHQIREAIAQYAEPAEAWGVLFKLNSLRSVEGFKTVARWHASECDNESLVVARAIYAHSHRRSRGRNPADALTKAVARFPVNADLLAYRIETAIRDGDEHRAIELLESAPRTALEDYRFWKLKAEVHEIRQEIDPAIVSLHRSLKLYPLDWRCQKSLARLHRLRNEPRDAVKYEKRAEEGRQIEKILQSQPDSGAWLRVPELSRRMAEYATRSEDPDAARIVFLASQ